MNLSADVMGNEPHDALAVGCSETLSGIRQPSRQPIDPEPAIGIEHDLDDPGVFEPGRYRRSERSTQHACTTGYRLGLKGTNCHAYPQGRRAKVARPMGISRKSRLRTRATSSDQVTYRGVAKEADGEI